MFAVNAEKGSEEFRHIDGFTLSAAKRCSAIVGRAGVISVNFPTNISASIS